MKASEAKFTCADRVRDVLHNFNADDLNSLCLHLDYADHTGHTGHTGHREPGGMDRRCNISSR
ncbi:hypothetical protein [Streptomyces sp. NPDC054887]